MIAFTLHRYIFGELLKVFLLTTIALTLILSLGSTITPIQKYGVGPDQVVKVLIYFLPITLSFTLPVAAMFASSLVYGRLATDNELDACRASGVSMMTAIYPGLCLAIVVAISTLILSFHVVPDFIHRAERTIKDNAKQILFRNIQRKGHYVLPDRRYRIWADHAIAGEDLLMGVVITEARMDRDKSKDDAAVRLITADSAKVVIENKEGYNEVTVVARETYRLDEDGNQVYSSLLPVSGQFSSLLSDKIKFQKIEQIKQIKLDIMNFRPIREMAENAGAQLAMEMLAEKINAAAQKGQPYAIRSERHILLIECDHCRPEEGKEIRLFGGPGGEEANREAMSTVTVKQLDKDLRTLVCTYQSPEASIKLDGHNVGDNLVMILKKVDWELADGIRSLAPSARQTFQRLAFPEDIMQATGQDNLLATLTDLDSVLTTQPSGALERMVAKMLHETEDAYNEITSEMHSRLVFGIGCISLILLSIAYGMKLRGGHLLSAFGVSAIPAAILIVAIMTGKNLITSRTALPQNSGIALMWICLALLSLATLITYRRMMRT